jgi:hypothetical protein
VISIAFPACGTDIMLMPTPLSFVYILYHLESLKFYPGGGSAFYRFCLPAAQWAALRSDYCGSRSVRIKVAGNTGFP